jgi:hypothetical protein
MKQAASLKDFTPDVLLPNLKINISMTDFAPISQLRLQRFKGEKWELFGDVISADVGAEVRHRSAGEHSSPPACGGETSEARLRGGVGVPRR